MEWGNGTSLNMHADTTTITDHTSTNKSLPNSIDTEASHGHLSVQGGGGGGGAH